MPTTRYEQCDDLHELSPKSPSASLGPVIKPTVFWLLVTPTRVQEDFGDLYENDAVIHRYSRLSSQTRPANLDAIPNWRQKFPCLEPLYNAEELDCDIIHMDVSLQLMETHVQNGADLLTRSEISIPSQTTERCEWQTVTNLIKPPELCRDSSIDSPWDSNIATTKIVSTSPNETRLKVRFPAEEWAHIFPRLTDLQLKYEESQRSQSFGGKGFPNMIRPAQEFLLQISMHQEIQSRSMPGMPFIRRAKILWTFRAALPGEAPQTTWRYIDATSPQSCISPSSCSSTQPSIDNFTTWGDGQSHLQDKDIIDPYVNGLISPPSTAGFQSSFGTDDYGFYSQAFDMPGNLGFESLSPVDSEPPMLDSDMARNITAFLSNTADRKIDGYDYSPPDWGMSHSASSNLGNWPGYAAIPSSAPYIESEMESHSWPVAMDPRLMNWVESGDGKGEWAEMDTEKPKPVYIEQSDDSLMPWLNTASNEAKEIYANADDIQLPKLSYDGLSPGPLDLKEPRWTRSDSSFDFNQLAERLGA